jgi:hypothetical protein
MTPLRNSSSGQSLVESLLLLPLLLVLLAGGYWAFRHFNFTGSLESAAQAHLLRTGRRLSSIESGLSRMIHPGNADVRFGNTDVPLAGKVPLFRGMSGTTVGSAHVSFPLEPVGAYLELPTHAVRRESEGAVDCWGKETRSGSRIRRTVQGVLLTGLVR